MGNLLLEDHQKLPGHEPEQPVLWGWPPELPINLRYSVILCKITCCLKILYTFPFWYFKKLITRFLQTLLIQFYGTQKTFLKLIKLLDALYISMWSTPIPYCSQSQIQHEEMHLKIYFQLFWILTFINSNKKCYSDPCSFNVNPWNSCWVLATLLFNDIKTQRNVPCKLYRGKFFSLPHFFLLIMYNALSSLSLSLFC